VDGTKFQGFGLNMALAMVAVEDKCIYEIVETWKKHQKP
jgi:hypothetical protein